MAGTISNYTVDNASYADNAGALLIKTFYNNSIAKYGVHEEIVQSLSSSEEEMQLWTNAYLAGLSQSFKNTKIQLSNVRDIVTESYINCLDIDGGRLPKEVTAPITSIDLGVTKSDAGYYMLTQRLILDDNVEISGFTVSLKRTGTLTGDMYIILGWSSDVNNTQDFGYAVSTGVDSATVSDSDFTDYTFTFAVPAQIYKNYFTTMVLDCTCIRNEAAGNYISVGAATSSQSVVVNNYGGTEVLGIANKAFKYTTTGKLTPAVAGKDNQIDTVDYSIGSNGLTVSVSAGQKLPDLAYQLKMIERRITNSEAL